MLSDNFLTSGGLILAADYSQLELRILAHLSCDCRLIQALNGGTDVFKSIAAEWKMIDLEAVGDRTRQQAKQVILGKKFNSSFLGRKVQCSTHCSMLVFGYDCSVGALSILLLSVHCSWSCQGFFWGMRVQKSSMNGLDSEGGLSS